MESPILIAQLLQIAFICGYMRKVNTLLFSLELESGVGAGLLASSGFRVLREVQLGKTPAGSLAYGAGSTVPAEVPLLVDSLGSIHCHD